MARRLTVITFKWRGWRPVDSAVGVNALGRMLECHLPIPHRFVCITDDPTGVETETFPCWEDPIVPAAPTHHACWRRLKMFSSWAAEQWPGWVLMLDLDVLIRGPIDSLVTWDDFRILKGAVSPYRGGMWLHRTGTRSHIWDTFDPETSPWECGKRRTKGKPWVGSDQGWISVCSPGERLYKNVDGVYVYNSKLRRRGLPDDARVVFPVGDIKPWHPEAAKVMPQIHREYQRWL